MAKISMVTPATRSSGTGNWVTAERWSKLLRKLGHRVRVRNRYEDERSDVLVAVHARRSAESVERFHERWPGKPIVVLLAGTDVYGDLGRTGSRGNSATLRSLRLATRIVVLQPLALREIPKGLRSKAVVILQSADPKRRRKKRRTTRKRIGGKTFDVVVLAHLRTVKDPMRAALAARLLPAHSKIRIEHAGRAMTKNFEKRTQQEMQRNPRYHWYGALPSGRARRLLTDAQVLVVSSRTEGGANVVSEAIMARVPILASRIPGTIGLLGKSYPGYYEVGDTHALARLLHRTETDPRFLASLRQHLRQLAPSFHPKVERRAWKNLLASLGITTPKESAQT